MSRLDKYRISYATSYQGSTPQTPPTLSALGVKSATITCNAAGADSMQLTAGVSLASGGFPFPILGQHTLRDGDNQARFIGWLTGPGRVASGAAQSQVFTFEGPNYLLRAVPYKQPWEFAVDPTLSTSATAPQSISRMILFRDSAGKRLTLGEQVKEVLDYAIDYGAKFTYGSLDELPNMVPLEDEQQDQNCLAVLERILRFAPQVARRWDYTSGTPELNFVGGGANTLTVVSDDGTIKDLQVEARYDLLVRKLTVYAMSSQQTTDDDSVRMATVAVDESVADNGSIIDQVLTYTLRGASNRKGADGKPVVDQEALPTGIAAALHEPFKTLRETLQWKMSGADVDWKSTLGMFVNVHRRAGAGAGAGTVGLVSNQVTTRSAIQQITRTLETGKTSFQAGPPTALGISDLLNARQAASSSRNAANNNSTHSGFEPGPKGPETKKTGKCSEDGGGGLPDGYWIANVNGEIAYWNQRTGLVIGVENLPAGAPIVNPF